MKDACISINRDLLHTKAQLLLLCVMLISNACVLPLLQLQHCKKLQQAWQLSKVQFEAAAQRQCTSAVAADLNIAATDFEARGHVQQAQLAGQANQSRHWVLQVLLALQQLQPHLAPALQVALAMWLSLQQIAMFCITPAD